MPKKKPPPVVRMEPVFARDYQRRIHLVIELLEQEAIRQRTALAQPQAEGPRVLTAAQASSGGKR